MQLDHGPLAVLPADGAPPAGPYSPGVTVGQLLFVSGQGPFDAQGARVGETFTEQANAAFDNVAKVAAAAGTGLDQVVRIGAFLSDLRFFEEWNQVCRQRLVGSVLPARTTVPAALPHFDIEIDAVLWIPAASKETS